MFSGEGEEVPFCETLYPTGNVEDWLLKVERVMRGSLKKIIEDSLINYKEVKFNNCHFVKGQIKHPHVWYVHHRPVGRGGSGGSNEPPQLGS